MLGRGATGWRPGHTLAMTATTGSLLDRLRAWRRRAPEIDNAWMASTNGAFVLPVSTALAYADWLTVVALMFAALASFAYHLVECHKHGMRGLGRGGRRSSVAWLWVDRSAAVLAVVRVLVLYADAQGRTFALSWPHAALFAVALLALRASEADHSPHTRERYMLLHSFWHVAAAVGADVLLRQYIYPVLW